MQDSPAPQAPDNIQPGDRRSEQRLRRELKAGEGSGYADFDWEDIEAAGDRLLANGTINRASAALPL